MRELPKSTDQMRSRLERSTRLHLVHWQVVIGSLLLTLFAWQMAKKQVDERVRKQFEREATQVVELVQERMQKYEDALWAGVALHETLGNRVSHAQWIEYADSMSIEEKYPGINGIGVIYAIDPNDLDAFEQAHKKQRSDFAIYPEHERAIAYPITYIEPMDANRAAVGLDIAHETNRFTAAEKARATGDAQITGPIVLVQDSNKTPGFLFYAPFYKDGHGTEHAGRGDMIGMVYAPFVTKNLMAGVLALENRHVNFRLTDAGETLYDELNDQNADYDATPAHAQSMMTEIYGRKWKFDVQAGHSFRTAQATSKPILILIGGILIDSMIFTLFTMLARANRQALQYADMANNELESKNTELEEYVYSASHDLKSPLFSIQGFANLLRDDLREGETENLDEYAECIITGTDRMRNNIEALLELSKVGRTEDAFEPVDCAALIRSTIDDLDDQIEINNASVRIEGRANELHGNAVRLRQVFENLIVNSIKYARPDTPLELVIELQDCGDKISITFSDNGPGIPEEYRERIFELFQRLQNEIEGTGVGLSIVRRVVEIHKGRVWIDDSPLGGARFNIELPTNEAHARAAAA